MIQISLSSVWDVVTCVALILVGLLGLFWTIRDFYLRVKFDGIMGLQRCDSVSTLGDIPMWYVGAGTALVSMYAWMFLYC